MLGVSIFIGVRGITENKYRSTCKSAWSKAIREMLGGENKSSVGAKDDQENMRPLGSNKFREALDFPPRVGLKPACIFSISRDWVASADI